MFNTSRVRDELIVNYQGSNIIFASPFQARDVKTFCVFVSFLVPGYA